MSPDVDIELVREAYPNADEPSPTRLASLRSDFVEAIGATVPPQPHARHRRLLRGPLPRRRLIAVALAIAVIAGVASGFISREGSRPYRPGAIETRAILRGAAAGLAVPAGKVLVFADSSVQTFPEGSTKYTGELWEDTSYPYDERNIARTTYPAKLAGQQEWAIVDNVMQLYDPARNTIYTDEPAAYTLRPSTHVGRYLLTPTIVKHPPTITITASQRRDLRDGQATIIWTSSHHVSVVPYRAILHQSFLVTLRKTAITLLRSGRAKVLYGGQFDGHKAIGISGPGPIPFIREETYYVTPGSYEPLGVVQHIVDETVTTQITTYRLLPGTLANRALVTLPGTHPHATIDTSPVDYTAANNRLFK